MEVDYIIVGCGLAGIAFCEQLRKCNKSYLVFDNNSQISSTVAGGLYNPVILKRFTPVWRSQIQMKTSIPIYLEIEKRLGVQLDYKIPVFRLFNSIEEQNNWFAASDKPNLSPWISTTIIKNTNAYIDAGFGFGEVLESGRIDTSLLIRSYRKDLIESSMLITESFDHNGLKTDNDLVTYNSINAKHIVFAEGFGIRNNPFFNQLPLKGSKGELLIIHAPKLKIDFVLKSSVFIIPIGEDNYIIGSTYNRQDKTNVPTPQAKEELLTKLNTFLKCEYEVIDQFAGIRPTVIDRRPLVGSHEQFHNIFVLNGLGTRGVMIAPYVAKQLYDFIETGMPLEKEINIERFN
ncbi:MAG: FAD-dependent oxidoreductase [Flavobacteriaceae bacterium]|nr:FAD-dependent oxidoreductase [Flavobacteriaceae bacterium]